MTEKPLDFYHCPNTRSTGVRILLEELDAPHTLHVLNLKTGEQRKPDFLAVNPLGKVPAIVHRGQLVTEQPAIFIYLADVFSDKGLAPAIDAPLRGPYLRWLVYYAASFEPAVIDKVQERAPTPVLMCPYGDFNSMLKVITDQLEKGPYFLGEKFSAADVLWGTALGWIVMQKLVPDLPIIMQYVKRVMERPAFMKIQADDAALAAEHEKAAEKLAENA